MPFVAASLFFFTTTVVVVDAVPVRTTANVPSVPHSGNSGAFSLSARSDPDPDISSLLMIVWPQLTHTSTNEEDRKFAYQRVLSEEMCKYRDNTEKQAQLMKGHQLRLHLCLHMAEAYSKLWEHWEGGHVFRQDSAKRKAVHETLQGELNRILDWGEELKREKGIKPESVERIDEYAKKILALQGFERWDVNSHVGVWSFRLM
ncbi:hypothetical protein H0H93_000781 [Arthromyces matolae]|nr:hypothetical protein H0H93_000781 [Arthromyces matolae]